MKETPKGRLKYYIPEPKRKHTILRVPGSHTLYVGPLSCTRRHAVSACKYGGRNEISFLFITESDVVSGHYEDLIIESVGKLIEFLMPAPHIFFISLFCIDDFLGTDENALIKRLKAAYPDRQFGVRHVDPVNLDERVNMGSKKVNSIYSFLLPQGSRDNGINFLGNFTSLDPECEFLQYIKDWGFGPVREIFNCKTYEEYQDMGKSALNVVLRFMGEGSAEHLRDEMGIPFVRLFTMYDPCDVAKGYAEVNEALIKINKKICKSDFSEQVICAQQDMEQTAAALDKMPLAIDSTGTLVTFDMAKALLKYGFNVQYIFSSSHKFKIDPEAEQYVRQNHPEVKILFAEDYTNLVADESSREKDYGFEGIAIGSDCARVLRAAHYTDIWHDEGYFGFHGIHRFMKLLRAAAVTSTDWSKVPELKIKKRGKK